MRLHYSVLKTGGKYNADLVRHEFIVLIFSTCEDTAEDEDSFYSFNFSAYEDTRTLLDKEIIN
jgi:hypothetical protein